MTKIKPTNKFFKTKSEYWKSKECKDRAQIVPLLTQNQKVKKSQTERIMTAGLEFMPMWRHACKWATSCAKTCLEGSGAQQIMKKNQPYLTSIDKCRLSRQWLMINNREQFDMRLQSEIRDKAFAAKREHMKLYVRLDTLSEYKLRDEYAELFPDVVFYDYFKEPTRIGSDVHSNIKEIYSWNEKSVKKHVTSAVRQGKPIAVVVPRHKHKEMFDSMEYGVLHINDTILVDGDASDLHCLDHSRSGQLVVSILKEKVTRYGQQDTKFLSSWERFFNIIN